MSCLTLPENPRKRGKSHHHDHQGKTSRFSVIHKCCLNTQLGSRSSEMLVMIFVFRPAFAIQPWCRWDRSSVVVCTVSNSCCHQCPGFLCQPPGVFYHTSCEWQPWMIVTFVLVFGLSVSTYDVDKSFKCVLTFWQCLLFLKRLCQTSSDVILCGWLSSKH